LRLIGAARAGGVNDAFWSGGLVMRLIVVMAHDTYLLMTALYADEYLLVQTKDTAGWLNQFLES
jgi:hypothetical protein